MQQIRVHVGRFQLKISQNETIKFLSTLGQLVAINVHEASRGRSPANASISRIRSRNQCTHTYSNRETLIPMPTSEVSARTRLVRTNRRPVRTRRLLARPHLPPMSPYQHLKRQQAHERRQNRETYQRHQYRRQRQHTARAYHARHSDDGSHRKLEHRIRMFRQERVDFGWSDLFRGDVVDEVVRIFSEVFGERDDFFNGCFS